MSGEFVFIVLLSLKVSLSAVLSALVFSLPIAFFVATHNFPLKRVVIVAINTLMCVPTVLIGLLLYGLLCRRGLLGGWGLLYTPAAMAIGQMLLAVPLITGLCLAALSRIGKVVGRTALSLGANKLQAVLFILREAKFALILAVLAGFGRVFSEVGISMMLGGNIRGWTRNITTAIALESSRGDFDLAAGLGVVLLVVALGVNIVVGMHLGLGEEKENNLGSDKGRGIG